MKKNRGPKNSGPKNTHTLPEAAVAAQLGVSAEQMRAAREACLAPQDWSGGNGRPIVFGEAAAQKLAAHFGVRSVRPTKVAGLLMPPAGTEVVLLAWRTMPNLRLLEAYLKGADPHEAINRVLVRVGDNRNFIRNMELPARRAEDGLWDLSRRPPRVRGRW